MERIGVESLMPKGVEHSCSENYCNGNHRCRISDAERR